MNFKTSINDIYPLLEEVINTGGRFTLVINGISMLPLLRDKKDAVILAKSDNNLKKYDVAFYKRKDGSFVLHRVIKVLKDGTYIMCGDNQVVIEKGIKNEQIVAVAVGFLKDGKVLNCDDKKYKKYAKNRVATRILRKISINIKAYCKKIGRLFDAKK